MSSSTSLAPFKLPPLVFGEQRATLGQGFHGMVDQFSHLTPDCDYDTKAHKGFLYKGTLFDVNGVVINQNYYSHMLAVSSVRQHNILIPLAGTHHGLFRGHKLEAFRHQGFFIPANDRFQFETGVDEIAGSLIVSYDLERLNQVILAMSGNSRLMVREERVRPLPLLQGAVDFKHLFLNLFAQIDAFGGDLALLKLNGFDDQFYRLLAMSVRPEHFLNRELADQECRAAGRDALMAMFERHVEENIDRPIHLSELEAVLGVTSRALQYACMRRHGCPPRVYIRNRRLELAHQRLRNATEPLKLARLAYELGFSSQSQFTRYFRDRFGVLPSELQA